MAAKDPTPTPDPTPPTPALRPALGVTVNLTIHARNVGELERVRDLIAELCALTEGAPS